jgi:dCTP deaminase
MVLSDREIEELCTVPKFAITTLVPGTGPDTGVYWLPTAVETFSHLTEDQLKERVQNRPRNLDFGIVSYRPLTEEEKINFRPMLTPFVAYQVRTRRRTPTFIERAVWENSRQGGQDIKKEPSTGGQNISDVPYTFVSDDPSTGLQIEDKIISYGLSSFGYDIRIARKFKIFTNINSTIVDPKNFDPKSFVDFEGDSCIIPPNSFVLAHSVERFDVPEDICGIVVGKSTYARTGISCLCTPVEPGWTGHLTLEFANTTPLPAKIYASEGGCQIVFFRGQTPSVTYSNRDGKYQCQPNDIVLPKV